MKPELSEIVIVNERGLFYNPRMFTGEPQIAPILIKIHGVRYLGARDGNELNMCVWNTEPPPPRDITSDWLTRTEDGMDFKREMDDIAESEGERNTWTDDDEGDDDKWNIDPNDPINPKWSI